MGLFHFYSCPFRSFKLYSIPLKMLLKNFCTFYEFCVLNCQSLMLTWIHLKLCFKHFLVNFGHIIQILFIDSYELHIKNKYFLVF